MQSPPVSLLNRDRVSGLIFLLACLIYGYQTTQIQLFPGDEYEAFTARTLPYLLTFAGIVMSLLLIVMSPSRPCADNSCAEQSSDQDLDWRLLGSFVILMVGYGIGLTWLGFVLATSLFLLIGFWLLGERRKAVLLGASFPFVTLFWLLLTKVLDIYLEPGYLFLSL
ncbi:MAG: tripartite tricarboxylate transporter TctB family protein [Moritella sp.]|uniref:tripartite tricarboxylate transporter TctB family protein n=1 Tax=unclassified Moritella TaxID=2637987 RepID=UPI0001568427|nr:MULTISPECIES: tripartite tricarboxylate transporter TctB family protein [unclassified Moritella]EDM67345.1 putative tricarboxylic transport TctB [Moritella sp. PE36]MBL1417019.1 tripartite tricarboxylate transporter TctB family protein [Moritella sp.]